MTSAQIIIILLNLIILVMGGHVLNYCKKMCNAIGMRLGVPITVLVAGLTFTCMASASKIVTRVVTYTF